MTISYPEPKMPSIHPADLVIGLCCSSFLASLGPPSPTNRLLSFPKSPEAQNAQLSGAIALPARHVGLVAVIAVVDLLLMAASFAMPGKSYWLLVGRDGSMCGFVDAETGFQAIWPLQWHPLCRSKLMVCIRVTWQGWLYGWNEISAASIGGVDECWRCVSVIES